MRWLILKATFFYSYIEGRRGRCATNMKRIAADGNFPKINISHKSQSYLHSVTNIPFLLTPILNVC